jgi:ribosome-binding factor A
MKPHQLDRANGYIKEELSMLLGSVVADPRVRSLLVTDVDLTSDRRMARVYVSCYDEEADLEDAKRGLESAIPFLRRQLGEMLGWRFAPDLVFRVERSLQRAARLDKLFKQLEEEQAAKPAPEGEPEKHGEPSAD